MPDFTNANVEGRILIFDDGVPKGILDVDVPLRLWDILAV